MLSLLSRLVRDPRPLLVLDTHAGAGLYDLEGPEAQKSKEALADRILEPGDVLDTGEHGRELLAPELEPVEERPRGAAGLHFLLRIVLVPQVGCEDRLPPQVENVTHRQERGVLRLCGQRGECQGRVACPAGNHLHTWRVGGLSEVERHRRLPVISRRSRPSETARKPIVLATDCR